jgi:NADH:ubiquinone oxidoreductase subunit 4 (subunit M)
MLLTSLIALPITGAIVLGSINTYKKNSLIQIKTIALTTSVLNLILSFVVFVLFNSSTNQFQFVQEHYNVQHFDIFLGIDSISIYFVLLTTLITPIALLSN